MPLQSMAQHGTARHGTALHGTARHATAVPRVSWEQRDHGHDGLSAHGVPMGADQSGPPPCGYWAGWGSAALATCAGTALGGPRQVFFSEYQEKVLFSASFRLFTFFHAP